jgi:hypothetical protein
MNLAASDGKKAENLPAELQSPRLHHYQAHLVTALDGLSHQLHRDDIGGWARRIAQPDAGRKRH